MPIFLFLNLFYYYFFLFFLDLGHGGWGLRTKKLEYRTGIWIKSRLEFGGNLGWGTRFTITPPPPIPPPPPFNSTYQLRMAGILVI